MRLNLKKLSLLFFVYSFTIVLKAQEDRASLVLDLKKAKATYEAAFHRFENNKLLFEEKAISQSEYSTSKNELLAAEVEYQKLMLRLISEQSYIVVEKAIKYQTPSGDKRVRVTVRSSLEGNQDYLRQFQEHADLFTPEMKSGKTYNVFVSLNDLIDKTIIGSPYEIRISSLDIGKSIDIDFGLLKDVESLQILLNYNNKKEEKNILLEKDSSTNFVDVKSNQFSQEADLGSNANYDLTLERFSSSDDIYKLTLVNLPQQISYVFEDATTGARLSSIGFNQGDNVRNLALKVYLPERDDEDIIIDKPIVFYALVISNTQEEAFNLNINHNYTEKELQTLQGGKIKLELIPRGVGKLEVKAMNLYHETYPGELVKMDIIVKNYGTRRVDNISIETNNLVNWTTTLSPNLIRSLMPEQEQKVEIIILPSNDVGVGAQEIKIKTKAYADNKMIEANERSIRIQVLAKTNVVKTVLLVIVLLLVVGGVVIFGLKISKK